MHQLDNRVLEIYALNYTVFRQNIVEKSVGCCFWVRRWRYAGGRRKCACFSTPWRSTQILPRGSLLSKRLPVAQYTGKCYVPLRSKEKRDFPCTNFYKTEKKCSRTKFHQYWTMNVENTDRISSSPQSHVKCYCHQNDLHETYVWSATFLKDSWPEFHGNPTNSLVGNTRIQTDWRMDMVST